MQATTPRIAWRNLWRNPRRTGLSLLAIGIGQWAVLATQGLMRGYGDNIQRAVTGPMIGHVQVHHPDYRDERALDLAVDAAHQKLNFIDSLPRVADAAGRVSAPVLIAPEREAFIGLVMGVDVQSESRPFGLLSGNEDPLRPGHVLIGYRLAEKCGAEPGDEVALVGQAADGSLANDLYMVQSILKGPSDPVNQSGIVMGLEDAQEFLRMPDQVTEIVIRAKRSDEVESLVSRLRNEPALQDLEILQWRELVPELVMIIDMVDYTGWIVLVLVLIAAVAGIINTLVMATYERMHEFGMLLALGCRPGRIVAMIMIEALLLAVLGVGIGTVIGLAFLAVTRQTGIDLASWGGEHVEDLAYGGIRLPLDIIPRIEPFDPMVGLVAVILVSLLASFWPAASAARLDPMEAMRS